MPRAPFISKPENYDHNIREGYGATAGPAILSGHNGRENAVIIRSGHHIKFILPTDQAIRIANEIADAVEAIEGHTA